MKSVIIVVTAQLSFRQISTSLQPQHTSIEKTNGSECLWGEALGCSSSEGWRTKLYIPGSLDRDALPDLEEDVC